MSLHCSIPYYNRVLPPLDTKLDVYFDDRSAFRHKPTHRWLYNRLTVADLQGIDAGLAQEKVPKAQYPVFVKPLYNLDGMGRWAKRLEPDQMLELTRLRDKLKGQGLMWMEPLEGQHLSVDVVVVDGEIVEYQVLEGIPSSEDPTAFERWEHRPEQEPSFDTAIVPNGYTGFMNVETIGGDIIECHLRMSPSSIPIYGKSWVESAVLAMEGRSVDFRTDGYDFVFPLYTDTTKRFTVDDSLPMPEGTMLIPTLTEGWPDKGSPRRKVLVYAEDVESWEAGYPVAMQKIQPKN